MNDNKVFPPGPTRRGRVMALHCSGAGASQWNYLAEALGGGYEVLAPEHFGNESIGPWTGEHPFSLADEAARTIALIDECEGKVHLVGHSYGGGVALNVALARPTRIASLALIRWSPKAPLDFRALIEEPTAASSYRDLDLPVLILRGEHAPLSTRVIAVGLSRLLPARRLLSVDGAGHMGPLTHAPEVSALIVQHVDAAETEIEISPPRSWHSRRTAPRTAQVVS
jgi:pimeloyl-ACP methyl ester carboxylesterase